ncbi:hypothetical protein PQJ75_00725 [Rhodoplanes sp. TEM]|uniref:Bro-N domain-containing protein n=1 Tax=Rhodoplanes tepidamans TaxID=200616 RepID=A0ABT5J5V7_RHOTP|nr:MULTISPECIES: hypothetical protein [Rhodoplanes]MDC7784776.1 hypothetical protein [Rhodoplanes tepidamans]MDC7982243.1 hypothetical protein [Rhodoplanes sp. TEM]MDQ0356250.1 hypothetical protein [Rhodoplanes tepidamans]
MADVDWSDPCARAAALRAAYYAIVGGQGTQRIRFADREVWFTATKIDVLRTELRQAEAECAAKQGVDSPHRRFAIRAGSRRLPRTF